MRNFVFRQVQDLPLASAKRSVSSRIFDALKSTPKLFFLIIFGSQRDIFVQSYRSALRDRSGDAYYDINFDALLMRGVTFLKVEVIDSLGFNENAKRALYPAHLNATAFTFWGGVLSKLLPVHDAGFSRKVSALLRRDMQLDLSEQTLNGFISTVRWQAIIYSMLLKRIRPKSVLVADTGTYGLRLAADRCGIPFIELQHGLFDAAHPDAVPLDVQGSRSALFLPDVLAVRGEFWARELVATRQGSGVIGAVGNEQIDKVIARRASRKPDGRTRLVFTSQGCDLENLVLWLEGFISSAPSHLDWELAIKLHPIYDETTKDYDPFKGFPNVRVITGFEQPNIFDLLVEADAHLSISSAAHYDAAAVGVRTFVIPLASSELVARAVDGKAIVLLSKPSDLWMHLSSEKRSIENGAVFSKPGYVENLSQLIRIAQIEPHSDRQRLEVCNER